MKQIQKNRAFTFSIIFIIIVGIVGYFGGNSLGLFNGSEEKYNPKYSVISDVDSSEFISIDILRETLFDDKTETNILIVGKLESFDTISDDINTDYELKTHATGLYLEYVKTEENFAMQSKNYFDISLSNGKFIHVSIQSCSFEFEDVDGMWMFSANAVVDLIYSV